MTQKARILLPMLSHVQDVQHSGQEVGVGGDVCEPAKGQ